MRTQKGEAGYVLFGIATGIVIMSIFMVAAVPYWQKVVQREREQELIFRGYQYIRAVELYQQKFPGAFPPNVDVLLEQKFLRNIYKDPFTGEDFKIIRQLSPEMQIGANQQSNAQQSNTGLSNINLRCRIQVATVSAIKLERYAAPLTSASTRSLEAAQTIRASVASSELQVPAPRSHSTKSLAKKNTATGFSFSVLSLQCQV